MSRTKQTRISKLRKIVSQNRSLHVKAAAQRLGVSEMTIRRDIRENPAEFDSLGGHIFSLERGAARSPYDLGNAVDLNKPAKRAACRKCLGHIRPGDTIFIDCGTTLWHLVDLLPDDLVITIVCYALNIADITARKPHIKMILIGGEYHPKTASFALLNGDTSFGDLAITTGFFSASGIDQKLGVSCSSIPEAAQKRAAMARSQTCFLVCDDSKHRKISTTIFAKTTEFAQIITESSP